jgi:putative sigma-54 modulation protein
MRVNLTGHHAESTVSVRGSTIHAYAEDQDMYAAIDALADRPDRRVRAHKERAGDHHATEVRRHGFAAAH